MACTNNQTKVYYYLEGDTPFLSIIQVPPDQITLGDFKEAFQKKNYKYFCKEFDPDLDKEVKVELSKDEQKLNKSQNGFIELVLLPIYPATAIPNHNHNYHSVNGGTLPRMNSKSMPQESFKLKKRTSAQALSSIVDDEIDIQMHRVSLATDPSAFTAFSKRAGEHLADVFSSDDEEDDDDADDEGGDRRIIMNDDDEILAGSNESSKYGASFDSPKHKSREPKAYVPSTISSATHSSSHSASLPRLDEIKISMKNASSLGIQVVDHDGGVFVSCIKPGSAADICGLLEIGDQIIQVNSISFEYLTINQAIAELQKVAKSKRTITMFVAKRPHISDQKSDLLSETTMPLDVSGWIEATTKTDSIHPYKEMEGPPNNNNNFSLNDDGITSDEENAAYIDRRNGAGAVLVPALHNFRNNNCFEQPSPPLPSSNHIAAMHSSSNKKENDENEFLNLSLTTETDPILILRRMVHPKSSLTIADRKWLKIPFKNSCIGNEMIHWLMHNVTGFKNKKDAVKYANFLLGKGYIRHVLNEKQFDKKRYYYFHDSIIEYRKQIEQIQMQNYKNLIGMGSAKTEVTFLGSPTYPAQSAAMKPSSCGMLLPGPSQTEFIATQNSYLTGSRIPTLASQSHSYFPATNNSSSRSPFYPPPANTQMQIPYRWPISPVLGRACETPHTNDYESMITTSMPLPLPPPPLPLQADNKMLRSTASPPPNTPCNTLSANSSTALLQRR